MPSSTATKNSSQISNLVKRSVEITEYNLKNGQNYTYLGNFSFSPIEKILVESKSGQPEALFSLSRPKGQDPNWVRKGNMHQGTLNVIFVAKKRNNFTSRIFTLFKMPLQLGKELCWRRLMFMKDIGTLCNKCFSWLCSLDIFLVLVWFESHSSHFTGSSGMM